jgi:hypothetical protein
VWEAAHATLLREYVPQETRGERVVPGGASLVSRLYEAAIRLLDIPRIPLLVRKGIGPLNPEVALQWPAAAVLEGGPQGEDSPELRYALGRALGGALPHNALLLGLPPAALRTVWAASMGAFGPPELGSSMDPASARLAETFWQTIPSRTQRRLQEILVAAKVTDLDAARARALQCGRRIGLFMTGDLAVVGRAVVAEDGPTGASLRNGMNLARLCNEVPALGDLVRLAVSPEYADARWVSVPASTQRGNMPSGRFSVF